MPKSGLPKTSLRREATSSTAQREPGSALSPQSAPVPTFPKHAICDAYAQGASVTTIARAAGLSDPEIRRILVANGVTIRPRGGGHDNARALAELRAARALRPRHASAPQFSTAWFRQCDRAYVRAVRQAHPERAHREKGAAR